VIEIPLEATTVGGGRGTTPGLPVQESGPPAAAADDRGPRRSILLVEDHSPTRVALERLLQRRNFHVLVGASAAEARQIAGREKIDLVISDIGLPDGNGYELMAELEERYQLKGIALTGYGVDAEDGGERPAGFSVQLMKPVSMQALEAAIAATVSAAAEG
jgi:DNA-binding response OmpR family regulator